MVWNDSYFIAIAKNATAHKVTYLLRTRYFLLHILCQKTHYFRPRCVHSQCCSKTSSWHKIRTTWRRRGGAGRNWIISVWCLSIQESRMMESALDATVAVYKPVIGLRQISWQIISQQDSARSDAYRGHSSFLTVTFHNVWRRHV